MKLTKGRISKLYSKIKQTLKHYKTDLQKNNKSFRKKRPTDLTRKTLKNFKGGQEVTAEPIQQQQAPEQQAPEQQAPEQQAPLNQSASENVLEKEKEAEVMDALPAVTDSQAAESPLLAEVKADQEAVKNEMPAPVTSSEQEQAQMQAQSQEQMQAQEQTQEQEQAQAQAPEQMQGSYNRDLLPENVSVAAKTIMDYALGTLAKKIQTGEPINNGIQNPESALTNMTNILASTKGGSKSRSRSRRCK